jgi:hypothetical protein
MTRIQEDILKASLSKVIQAWLDSDEPGHLAALPYMGDETVGHMASAAINILAAIDDVHMTLDRHGELKDESEG